MSDYEATEDTKYSKYNSAFLNNERLHNLWLDSHRHKRQSLFSAWNADLDAVWCELAGDVKEGDENDKAFEVINKELNVVGPILNWQGNGGFNKVTIKLSERKTQQYRILIKKEVFLRRLQNNQGKGTAYQDGSEDYMDG